MKRLLIIDGMNCFVRNYVVSPQLDINGKQKTAYEIPLRLVGSEMCIRDSPSPQGKE